MSLKSNWGTTFFPPRNVFAFLWLLTRHSRLAPGESSPSFSRSSFQRSFFQRSSSPGSSSHGSSSRTSVVDEEEYKAGSLELEKEAYNALVADGGQPSHPVSLGFDVLDNPGQYEGILWALHSLFDCYMSEFRVQHIKWQRFQEYQKKMRQWYIERGIFHDYQNTVREGQEGVLSPWDLDVNEDDRNQNRLQHWIEFRAFYYRKARAQQSRIEPAEQKYLQRKRELDAFETGLSSPVQGDDTFAKAWEAERRIQDARGKIRAAERRLAQAKAVNAPTETMERAEQELQLAKKRWGLQHNLRNAERGLYRETQEGKKLAVYLKWIDDQYPLIAAECGYHTEGMVIHTAFSKEANLKGRKSKSTLRRGNRMQTRSVLGPTAPSKVSKSSRSKANPRPEEPQLSFFNKSPLNTKQYSLVEEPVPLRQSERLRKSRTKEPTQRPESKIFKPIHSSRVCKVKANNSTTRQPVSFSTRCAQTEQSVRRPRRKSKPGQTMQREQIRTGSRRQRRLGA